MAIKPPLRYEFEISHHHDGLRVRGTYPRVSMWTRNVETGHMLKALMRHAGIHTRIRGMTPKRTTCVIEGDTLRCLVFTV